MLLLTNVGWNHPNETIGLQFARTKRLARLINGVINHPWFHSTAWEDIEKGTEPIYPNVRYYLAGMPAGPCTEDIGSI